MTWNEGFKPEPTLNLPCHVSSAEMGSAARWMRRRQHRWHARLDWIGMALAPASCHSAKLHASTDDVQHHLHEEPPTQHGNACCSALARGGGMHCAVLYTHGPRPHACAVRHAGSCSCKRRA